MALTLNDVSFDIKYHLCNGSTTQIMRGLSESATRLPQPVNAYQNALYPQMLTLINEILAKYNTDLLTATNEVSKTIRNFSLHGYNGKIKAKVMTRGVHNNAVYAYAKFGDYLKCAVQRLDYISKSETPTRYTTDEEKAEYETLKIVASVFVKYLTTDVFVEWNKIVSNARKVAGVEKKKYVKPVRIERRRFPRPDASGVDNTGGKL